MNKLLLYLVSLGNSSIEKKLYFVVALPWMKLARVWRSIDTEINKNNLIKNFMEYVIPQSYPPIPTLLTNTLVQTYSSVVCSYFGVRKMISFMKAFYSSRRPGEFLTGGRSGP